MVAFLYRMPAGIVGTSSRYDACTIVPEIITPVGTTGAPTAFGIAVCVDTVTAGNIGNMRAVLSTDTAIYGFLVRAFPAYSPTNDPLGTSTPPNTGTCSVMKRGFLTVALGGSTAAVKGGVVNLWVAASTGAHVQGQVEAAATAGSTIVIPNTFFEGPADANGITELQYNL